MEQAVAIVEFWKKAGPGRWFARDAAFDALFRERFLDQHLAASRREYEEWLCTADGVLGLMLLLDQFPRNAFRGTAHAYATDPLARHYAMRAIEEGVDLQIEPQLRAFVYLPFEHSEDPVDQQRSVAMFQTLGDARALEYALIHQDVIARFGRFPHRNAALGRIPTVAELEFLADGGFAA